MSFDLSDYVDVGTRILRFYERHPDGRIAATPAEVVTIDDRRFLAVTAYVYRTPDDPQPCVGTAWEPWPGRTPYTKDSEAMNAETSAVGRALALAGIEVRRSIASADEVRARRDQPAEPEPVGPDWGALGWEGQGAHDARMVAVRASAGELDEASRSTLAARWRSLSFRWPLSVSAMTTWEGLVGEARKAAGFDTVDSRDEFGSVGDERGDELEP